jgi:hypothetical protein
MRSRLDEICTKEGVVGGDGRNAILNTIMVVSGGDLRKVSTIFYFDMLF